MFSNQVKKILAGIMIFFDIFIAIVFGSLYFEELEAIYLFLMGATIIDIGLTADYIMTLIRQDKAIQAQEAEETIARVKRQIKESDELEKARKMDRQMANDIRQERYNDDPDELRDLLTRKEDMNENLHG